VIQRLWHRESGACSTSADKPKVRVALIGIRGLPAQYGGSETAAQEIYPRLAARGHAAVVYCRRHSVDPAQQWYEGVRTVVLPSVNTKALDTITATFLALLDVVVHDRADIIHIHGIGNAVLFPLFRACGKRVVTAVDGMDWTRAKWNRAERAYLRLALYLAVKWADDVYVDSLEAQRLCRALYGRTFPLIAYGTQIRCGAGTEALSRHGLEPEKYLLFVGRLIPEKGVHHLIAAYRQVETDFPLVIVGDNPYHPEYVQQLKDAADERVLFVGTEFGEAFWQLCANCYVYVQPSEVEGTSPVVLSAMGCGRCVVVNGIQENVDTIGEAGLAFYRNDVDDLAGLLRELLANPAWVRHLGAAAQAWARELYDWDRITDQHEELFWSVVQRRRGRRRWLFRR
jgi:glycosyltransferase involved in cell wall biosynthesis